MQDNVKISECNEKKIFDDVFFTFLIGDYIDVIESKKKERIEAFKKIFSSNNNSLIFKNENIFSLDIQKLHSYDFIWVSLVSKGDEENFERFYKQIYAPKIKLFQYPIVLVTFDKYVNINSYDKNSDNLVFYLNAEQLTIKQKIQKKIDGESNKKEGQIKEPLIRINDKTQSLSANRNDCIQNKLLLENLFNDDADINSLEILHNYSGKESLSGALTFLVQPFTKSNEKLHPSIIKIDDFSGMYYEHYAYKKFIEKHLPNYTGRIEKIVHNDNNLAAVKYTAAGLKNNYSHDSVFLESLAETIISNKIKSKVKFISNIFNSIVNNLHSISLGRDDLNLFKFYNHYLPKYKISYNDLIMINSEPVEYRIHYIDRKKNEIEIRTLNQNYRILIYDCPKEILEPQQIRADKIAMLPAIIKTHDEYFSKLFEQEKITHSINFKAIINKISENNSKFKKGVVHGDLHLKNILISKNFDSVEPWLIDFGLCRKGYIAVDYAMFECSYRLDVLDDIVFVNNKQYKVIQRIRHIFQKNLLDYYCALFFLAVKYYFITRNKKTEAKRKKKENYFFDFMQRIENDIIKCK